MIDTHQSFRFAEKGTGKEFYAEVNWNGDDQCKKIRFTFPNGDKVVIDKSVLNAMLFVIGNREEQRKMIPQVQTRSRWYETVVSVEAKEDVKKGEKLTFPLKLTLPTFEEEIIGELKRDTIKKSPALIEP